MAEPVSLEGSWLGKIKAGGLAVDLTGKIVAKQVPQINRLVNDKQAWGIRELLALCDYLDVDMAELLSTAKAAV